MTKKIKIKEIDRFVEKIKKEANERGLINCIITDPVLKTQGNEGAEAELMQVTLTFAKPTKRRKIIYYC